MRGSGATLRMWRADYANASLYNHSEGRHAIALLGVNNVSIRGVTVRESGGDGVYVGTGHLRKTGAVCRDVQIVDATLTQNYRQGMSVIAVEGLVVENTVLSATDGTPPMAGVDFEPNDESHPLRGVRFTNVTASANRGRGFQFSLTRNSPATPPLDIIFERCAVEGGGSFGISLSGSGYGGIPSGGSLIFRNITVRDTEGSGLLVENKNGGATMVLENVALTNVSTAGGAPIWLEGQTRDCLGVSFSGVEVWDDRARRPVKVLGNVSQMSGGITVHNAALPPADCSFGTRPLPGVSMVCDPNA